MSGLGGGGDTTISTVDPVAAGLRIQTSAYGLVLPLVYGRTRVSGNLIWYGDFTAIPHTETTSSGGGGGKGGGGGEVTSSHTSYTYTASFALGLCEGPVHAINACWADKDYLSPASSKFTLFLGAYPQTAWSWLSSTHPGQAVTYQGVAYVAAAGYSLGSSDFLPNHSFDITGLLPFNVGTIDDANPRDILVDLLTNAHAGVGFPTAKIGSLTQFSNYCVASGLFFSPAYSGQEEASAMIARLLRLANSDVYHSEGLLKVTSRGDTAVSGNGATYTPNTTPLYDLTDDDFLDQEEPVRLIRGRSADAFNHVQVEYLNRANAYAAEPAEAKDQTAIDTHGLLTMPPVKAHEIALTAVARMVAQHEVQRALFLRNQYEFKVGWKYSLLEPTDIVTLTDADLELALAPVKILTIEEDADNGFKMTAEDFPAGVGHAPVYPSQAGAGYGANYNVSPGNVAAPAFIEAPVLATTTGLAVGVAVTGQDPNWGGCEVWVSYDGNSYARRAKTSAGARYGALATTLADTAGATCNVTLTGNGGQIQSASAVDAQELASLSLVGDELVAYTTATLLAANSYALTMDQRGVQNSAAGAHAIGERFVRLDDAIVWGDSLPLDAIGNQLWFKFVSFNIYGGGKQTLAEVAAYSYTIRGVMAKLPPSNVSNFTASADLSGALLSWNDIPDPERLDFEIRQGASWAAGVPIDRVAALQKRIPPLAVGSTTFWIAARDRFLNYSPVPASATIVASAPPAPTVGAAISNTDYVLSWSQVPSMFVIDHYEVRHGASWAAGTPAGTVTSTSDDVSFARTVTWGGSRTFLVAGVDAAGNVGASGNVEIVVSAPLPPVIQAQVVDNNVLLFWVDCTQTLPMASYELRRGATWAGAAVIGTKSGRFTSVFETAGGMFHYWLAGIDTAGNVGTPNSIEVTVSQPPDYVLFTDYDSSFSGTKSNAAFSAGTVALPVNTTETWAQHFTNNGWASPSAQITAGFPIYIEPAVASGYYEETLDYGTLLAGCKVTVTPTGSVIAGTPGLSTTLSVSANGSTWTDYVGVSEVYASGFRYAKWKMTVTSTGGDDLYALTALNFRIDAKQINDAGSVAAVSTDSGGTQVNFNVAFIDVAAIGVTPQSIGAAIPLSCIYDFTDVPNPTGFKVLVFRTDTGARVSTAVSWTVKGY